MENYIELIDEKSNEAIIIPVSQNDSEIEVNSSVVNSNMYRMCLYLDTAEFAGQITNLQLFINDARIRDITYHTKENIGYRKIPFYFNEQVSNKLFLLQYDLMRIKISFYCGGVHHQVITQNILCLTEDFNESDNIEKMMEFMMAFDDNDINKAIFETADSKEVAISDKIENSINQQGRTINSILDFSKSVISIYNKYYSTFKKKAKDLIKEIEIVTDAENVSKISPNSVNWLIHNPDVLIQTTKGGVSFLGESYLPRKMSSTKNVKTFDIYENQIVVGLPYTLCEKLKEMSGKYEHLINLNQSAILKMESLQNETHKSPIITIRKRYLAKEKETLFEIEKVCKQMYQIYRYYSIMFSCKGERIVKQPRNTKVFSQIRYYSIVYSMILQYLRYTDIDYNKEDVISRVKTIDDIYEYYCLMRMMDAFKSKGYVFSKNNSTFYDYEKEQLFVSQDKMIQNTYYMEKESTSLTIYFQPIIYNFESKHTNGIDLYRTTCTYHNCFSPDFVLAFNNYSSGVTKYVILDAKYRSRYSLETYKVMEEIIEKYSSSIATASPYSEVIMVWILQGKVERNGADGNMILFHSSEMAHKLQPLPSFGRYELNGNNNIEPLTNMIEKLCE